jgi:hypothetical protein
MERLLLPVGVSVGPNSAMLVLPFRSGESIFWPSILALASPSNSCS